MEIMNIVYPILSIGGMGLVFGAGLGYAGKIFEVKEDPKIGEILGVLPGANCGGCGFPGCGGLSAAIVAGNAPVNACPVGGAAVATQVAKIMGVTANTSDPKAAFVKCKGTCTVAKEKYQYIGIDDCIMAAQLAGGGSKSCEFGCLGLGSCQRVCAFGAIEIVDGVAVINQELCTSCGKCISTCPKHIIELLPTNKKVKVACSSKDNGKTVMGNCTVGCISCKICEKICKFDAIHVIDNIAVIDYEKCKNCGMCANKCPKNVITGKRVEIPKSVTSPKSAQQNLSPAQETASADSSATDSPSGKA